MNIIQAVITNSTYLWNGTIKNKNDNVNVNVASFFLFLQKR